MAVDLLEQVVAVVQRGLAVEVGGQVELLDAVVRRVGSAVQEPGVGRPAQEARVLARPDAAVGVEDPVRQRDGGRQSGPGRSAQALDDQAPAVGESFGGPGLAFSKFIGWCGRPVSM